MPACTLSVSIVVYDLDTSLLLRVFKSLEASILAARTTDALSSYALTVIDNGQNGDQLKEILPAGTHSIENETNIGFGMAHNQALLASTADVHLVLNPDVILSEDAIKEALRFMHKHPATAACGPLGTDESGDNLYLSKRYPAVIDLLLRGFAPPFISKHFSTRLENYEYRDLVVTTGSAKVTLLSGCCLFVRTELAKRVEGFDSRYFLYFEDYDLTMALSHIGEIRYVPSIRVIHYGGNSSGKGIKHILMFCRSALSFYRKNGWRFT